MTNKVPKIPIIEEDGWTLVSAEERQNLHPDTFTIPSLGDRMHLSPGNAVKLLFDIEVEEGSRIVDRGIDRMWVIVKTRVPDGYLGILDSDPGTAENLKLRPGDAVYFRAEHVADIDRPPPEYIIEKYGTSFFRH